MQNWKLVYNTTTGRLVSSGSGPIDSLPADLDFVELTAEETDGYRSGTLAWDETTRALIPTPLPLVSAEDWITSQGYTATRLVSLLDVEAKLNAAAKVSPKASAVRGWLDTVLGTFAADPAPKNTWPAAPHGYEETIQEAVFVLQS